MSSNEVPTNIIDFSFWPSGKNPYEQHFEYSVNIPYDSDIYAYHKACKAFMHCLGFVEATIEEVFGPDRDDN